MLRRRGLGQLLPALGVAVSAAFFASAKAEENRDGPFEVKVERIVADNALEVDALLWLQRRGTVSILIAGICVPKLRGDRSGGSPGAPEKFALAELVAPGAWVRLHDVVFDKYGDRIAARVVTDDGVDAAEALLERGLVQKMECGRRGHSSGFRKSGGRLDRL